jgi:hypothetical protein
VTLFSMPGGGLRAPAPLAGFIILYGLLYSAFGVRRTTGQCGGAGVRVRRYTCANRLGSLAAIATFRFSPHYAVGWTCPG